MSRIALSVMGKVFCLGCLGIQYISGAETVGWDFIMR